MIGIIPSRYASTRFPGKPLANILGKPMIRRVYEQASKCEALEKVIVATDDERIFKVVKDFGGIVEMTNTHHTNGTERCAEVARRNHADYYLNIQGDEPFIKPDQIMTLVSMLDHKVMLGTLVKKIEDPKSLENPNSMKVVINNKWEALYFSRNCLPHLRNVKKEEWLGNHTFYKHIGLYAYRSDTLRAIVKLPLGKLECAESLEQLRWLENGYTIKVAPTSLESVSIDIPEDIDRVLKSEGLL